MNNYKRPGVEVHQIYKPRGNITTAPILPATIIGTVRPVIEGLDALVGTLYNRTFDTSLMLLYPKKRDTWVIDFSSVHVFISKRGVPISPKSQTNILMSEINQPPVESISPDETVDITRFCTLYPDTVYIPRGEVLETMLSVNEWPDANDDYFDLYIEYTAIEKASLAVETFIDGNGVNDIFKLKPNIVTSTTKPLALYLVEEVMLNQSSNNISLAEEIILGDIVVLKGHSTEDTQKDEIIEITYADMEEAASPTAPRTDYILTGDNEGLILDATARKLSPQNLVTLGVSIHKSAGLIEFKTATPEVDEDYILKYYVSNPLFGNVHQMNSDEAIVETFGAIHPANPVAYASWLALMESDYQYSIYVVPTKTNAGLDEEEGLPSELLINSLEPCIAEVERALDLISPFEVYTISVLASENATDNSSSSSGLTIGELIQTHVVHYSNPDEGLERISALGYMNYEVANSLDSVNDNVFENPTMKINQIQALKKVPNKYNEKRIRVMFPPVIEMYLPNMKYGTISADSLIVPGWYITAAYAGLVSSTAPDNPSAPFTNVQYKTLKNVLFPGGMDYYYTKNQIDSLAGTGWWILEHDPFSNTTYNRHQLTTAVGLTESAEDSIVRAVDFTAKLFRQRFKPMVGKFNITPGYLNELTMLANATAEYLVAQEIAGAGTALDTLMVNSEDPTRIDMRITYQPLYPANRIVIELII